MRIVNKRCVVCVIALLLHSVVYLIKQSSDVFVVPHHLQMKARQSRDISFDMFNPFTDIH